jgi:hypothetical protein
MQYLYQLEKALFNRIIGAKGMGMRKGQFSIDRHLMVKLEYELGRLCLKVIPKIGVQIWSQKVTKAR